MSDEDMTSGYKMLNKRAITAMYIAYGALYLILLIALVLAYVFFGKEMGKYADLFIYISTAALILILVALIFAPRLYYHHYRYIISDDRIDIRYGVLIIRRILVPIERLHQVEVRRGPISNMFGLADLSVTTAGGVASIVYLELDEAERVAEYLNSLINEIIKGRKENVQ